MEDYSEDKTNTNCVNDKITRKFTSVGADDSKNHAGNDQWDYKGQYDLIYSSTYGRFETCNVLSTGGSFEGVTEYELWEYDPGSNKDDYVGNISDFSDQ